MKIWNNEILVFEHLTQHILHQYHKKQEKQLYLILRLFNKSENILEFKDKLFSI